MKKLYLSVFLFLILFQLAAQPFKLQVNIKNHPFNIVAVGAVRGDRFILSDSLLTQNIILRGVPVKTVTWNFPADARPGVYRIVLGQTTYARVMNEPPQQVDFIFNGEDIRFETDFKYPADSLRLFQSEENKVWFEFIQKEKELNDKLSELDKEEAYYLSVLAKAESSDSISKEKIADLKASLMQVVNHFNQIQMQRNEFITRTAEENNTLFISHLIKCYREPFRDGFLTPEERKASFQKAYLGYIDFSDESLVQSSVLTDKLFKYLVTFNQKGYTQDQRQNEYIKAVDAIMADVKMEAGESSEVYEFVVDYLVSGFEGLKMDKVLGWISDHYAEPLCKTEEKTTLRRKLEAHKMVVGSVVPDFTLNDLKGQPVNLTKALKDMNLVVFWASWCPHCNSMLPNIKSLCRGKSNMEVIAISLDRSANDWNNAVYKAGFEDYRNLSDLQEWNGKVVEDYNVYATPTMFLIDGNRKILAKPSSIGELAKAIAAF
jgi:thiol-disulfide isomerase/thioredoxin